jgi:hypothetical protein
MQRSIVIGGNMVPRRPSQETSDCQSIARSEFDALLATGDTPSETHRADELLEWIEESDVAVRFVPDWADESFRNAA